MSKALKGVLLSGLILPGLGQIVLKQYMRGVAFIVAVMVGLAVIMLKAAQTAMAIVEKSGPATENLDVNQMMTATNQAIAEAGTLGYNLALALIVLAWLFGAVDAYFVGRKLDRAEAGGSSNSAGR